MPNPSSSLNAGAPVSPECSDREPAAASDEPDQPNRGFVGRGFFARLLNRIIPPTALVRFLGYVRPHLWLVAGGSVMGILKFTLPLAFPLAFKYVFDVLLVPQPHPEHLNQMIDRWCSRDRRDASSWCRIGGQTRSFDGGAIRAVLRPGDCDLSTATTGRAWRAIG